MLEGSKNEVIKQFSDCTLASLALFHQNFNEACWQAALRCILDECHISVATQFYSSPPVFLHQQVHRGGGGDLCIQASID